MFIKVKGQTTGSKKNKKEDVSFVNTDFVQTIIGGQVQMADGSVYSLFAGSLEEALKDDPTIKALNDIAEKVANIKLTYYNGQTTT